MALVTAGIIGAGALAGGGAAFLSGKAKAKGATTTSTMTPKLPKEETAELKSSLTQGPKHYLDPFQRTQLYAGMEDASRVRARSGAEELAARSRGDTSSPQYQQSIASLEGDRAAGVARNIATTDIQDYARGDQQAAMRRKYLMDLINAKTSRTTVSNTKSPMDYGAVIKGALGGAASAYGATSGAGAAGAGAGETGPGGTGFGNGLPDAGERVMNGGGASSPGLDWSDYGGT
jgi:hypothetical protein